MRSIVAPLLLAPLLAACGGSGGSSSVPLVQVLVSQMTGAEPATIASDTHPDLFVLHPSVEHAVLTAFNPSLPFKEDLGPATWMPTLGPPSTAAPLEGGHIELTITPAGGAPVEVTLVTYTVAARFSGNPSSLRLTASDDGFSQVWSVVDLASPQAESVFVSVATGGAPVSLRGEAHDDFGEAGGGQAGFVERDLVVEGTAP
jgi:hypothetical protein